eukprot:COSAG04_NODE_7420_length_1131_cov_1.688953_1_plen_42_part_01
MKDDNKPPGRDAAAPPAPGPDSPGAKRSLQAGPDAAGRDGSP